MSFIPMTEDLSELIGANAERVENRSLLLEKFVVPKLWPGREVGRDGQNQRLDSAHHWSLLRLSHPGQSVLSQMAHREEDKSLQSLLRALAGGQLESTDSARLRSTHSRRFLALAQESFAENGTVLCARLKTRLAINLSDGIIENGGIALDRLFGLPYIPGSAVKGNARHAALAEIKAAPENERSALLDRFIAVFGSVASEWDRDKPIGRRDGDPESKRDQKGGVGFLAAYPVERNVTIGADITNVHTPDYYTGNNAGNQAQLGNEELRPNYFPVVEAGAAFGFIIVLNSIGLQAEDPQQLLADAKRWLEQALTVHGIGAKTGAGYGWFSMAPEILKDISPSGSRETADSAGPTTPPKNLSDKDKMLWEIRNLENEAFAAKVLELTDLSEIEATAIVESFRTDRKDRWKNWKKSKKPNDKKRVELTLEAIERYNLPHLP